MIMSNKKRVAILTSGGDASCMNKVISTFVHYSIEKGLEPYFIFDGFEGMYKNKIKKATLKDVRMIYDRAGTIIKSSRFPEFKEESIRKVAIANLKKHNIDTVFVCGGNGSYMGLLRITEAGIKGIGIPGTIDNDIGSSDYTIGYDSALNNIVESIKQIRTTMESHNFITVVEVMGRQCPDLTVMAGIGCEVDYIITKDNIIDEKEFVNVIKKLRKNNKESIVILVTELLYGVDGRVSLKEMCKYASEKIGEKVRLNILTYSQRAGTPTGLDLYNAAILTAGAIDHFLEGNKNFVSAIKNGKLTFVDVNKAVNMKTPSRMMLVDKFINKNL